jgi:hypothetical protein
MRLFRSPKAIAAEISELEAADELRREDRATVANFFNGAPPLTQEEADAQGISVNVNNLFGHAELKQNKGQFLSLYDKPTQLWKVTLKNAPVAVKPRWETNATTEFNRIIKDSNRLKNPYESVAGDSVLHGAGVFFYPSTTDWCPAWMSLARLLVPDSTPADSQQLTHFAIAHEIELGDLYRYSRFEAEGWKKSRINEMIRDMENKDKEQAAFENLDQTNLEDQEYLRQTNSGNSTFWRAAVQVYYFFQQQPDRINQSFDLTIMARFRVGDSKRQKDSDGFAEDVVFDRDEYYATVHDAIHPFFLDCNIGGTTFWHRVMGIGTLNYSLNWHVEMFMNRGTQAAVESMMNLWKAQDVVDREELQQLMLRHNFIIPEGVDLIQNRIQPNISDMLTMLQIFRSQGSKNALNQAISSPDLQKRQPKEKELQAQQGELGAAQSNQAANWYTSMDRLGATVFSRFTNPFIRSGDKGYSEIGEFQDAMERLGIPLYYLQGHNVSVKAIRLLGNGDQQSENRILGFFAQNKERFPPDKQAWILQNETALVTGDYAMAEFLSPVQNKPDSSQTLRAAEEENTAFVQGRPMPLADDDVDALHVQSHFKALGTVLSRASQNKQTFAPQDLTAFKALGAHVMAHIHKAEGQKNPAAKQWMAQLQKMTQFAEKFANNLKQQQQKASEQQQVDPVKKAEIELKKQTLLLQGAKFKHSVEKAGRTQHLREHQTAVSDHVNLSRENREERRAAQEMAIKDITTARELQQPMKSFSE